MSRLKWMQGLECRRRNRSYEETERRSLVAEFERRRAAGKSVRAIARALGVSAKNYYNWQRRYGSAVLPVLRSVTIVDAVVTPVSPCPVVISPLGYRVEGLSVADVATLLRALA